jgi:hypothetical protein
MFTRWSSSIEIEIPIKHPSRSVVKNLRPDAISLPDHFIYLDSISIDGNEFKNLTTNTTSDHWKQMRNDIYSVWVDGTLRIHTGTMTKNQTLLLLDSIGKTAIGNLTFKASAESPSLIPHLDFESCGRFNFVVRELRVVPF